MDIHNRNQIIEEYFFCGYSYSEIKHLLADVHEEIISLRQLKRILSSRGLFRRKALSRLEDVATVIEDELNTSGSCIGYRFMHQVLLSKHGIRTTRETVREVVKALDPEGVEARRSHRLRRRVYHVRGPNDVWHIDGNDKLIPYGLAIHGAIDGYSRKVLWLEVGRTNKNPEVTAAYFLKCVRNLNGTALTLRFDPGSENGLTADIQTVLTFGEGRSLYGRSTANQRIEAWWSFLKRSCLTWWINFFKDMTFTGTFDNSQPLQIDAVRYFFGPILQAELHHLLDHWNTHRMRNVRESECPGGRPNILFAAPRLTGTEDFKYPLDEADIDAVADTLEDNEEALCSMEVKEIIEIVMGGPCSPTNAVEALALFETFLARFANFH